MIGSLRGILAEKKSLKITIEVGGVGYDVQVPFSTFSELGPVGSSVYLKIHTHLRSESLSLFGFRTDLERLLFERLIQVPGIGPRTALALLSGLGVEELLQAVRDRDSEAFHRVPGIGRKTSDRLILELQDRLKAQLQELPKESGATGPGAGAVREDVISALTHLGYRGREIRAAMDRGSRNDARIDFETLLKETLQVLSKS
ncbi:MAG: Holliday junction branch migration protein RuvA [Acidobacteriota bacterium]